MLNVINQTLSINEKCCLYIQFKKKTQIFLFLVMVTFTLILTPLIQLSMLSIKYKEATNTARLITKFPFVNQVIEQKPLNN